MTTSDAELARAAEIPESALKAIRAVESNGRPTAVRFEPHVFLRDTSPVCRSRPSGERCTTAEILRNAIYTPAQVPFTPDPSRGVSLVGTETNRAAFERAYRLDPGAAVRATSWGSFQVLGGKLIALYETPSAGVRAFDANPAEVSNRLLVKWMQDNPGAAAAARAGDWAEFVHRYNGCSGSGCDRYVARFMEALGSSSGGMLIPAAIAAAGAVWYFSRGKRGGLRGTPVPVTRKRRR